MRFFYQVVFHLLVTAAAVLMIVFGVKNDNVTLWVWGIVVGVAGNILVYFLLFIIALLMIPAARKQDSLVDTNKNSIHNRVKYCKNCGKEVEYSIMICPNCGGKYYTEEKPNIEVKSEEE